MRETFTTPFDRFARVAPPLLVAGLLVACWAAVLSLGPTAAIDTHFTNRPHEHASFRLTDPVPAGPPPRLRREAVWPLTFFTLRYVQRSADGGATWEADAYYADPRWARIIPAMTLSAAAVAAVYAVARRLLHRSIRE